MKDFFIQTILSSKPVKNVIVEDALSLDGSESSNITDISATDSNLSNNRYRKTKNRKARVPFSDKQKTFLKEYFKHTQYLSGKDEEFITRQLDLDKQKVKIWFQNERGRKKPLDNTSNANQEASHYFETQEVDLNQFSNMNYDILKAILQQGKSLYY